MRLTSLIRLNFLESRNDYALLFFEAFYQNRSAFIIASSICAKVTDFFALSKPNTALTSFSTGVMVMILLTQLNLTF